jgi:hypothetical protein
MTLRLGIILLPLVAPAVLLPLAACDHKDFTESADRVEAVLRGDPPPDAGMYMAELPASSEEAVAAIAAADEPIVAEPLAATEPSSSEYVATAHQVCEPDWVWRGTVQPGACHVEMW